MWVDQVKVKAEDLDKARTTALAIRDLLADKGKEYVTDPTISLQDGLPQVDIVIDRERLYSLGLNIASVGQEIRANIAGTTSTKFRKDGEEIDIVVKLDERDRTKLGDLEQIFVTNTQGVKIPISSFARYAEGTSPISITRENQSRIITVSAGTPPGASINIVQAAVVDFPPCLFQDVGKPKHVWHQLSISSLCTIVSHTTEKSIGTFPANKRRRNTKFASHCRQTTYGMVAPFGSL